MFEPYLFFDGLSIASWMCNIFKTRNQHGKDILRFTWKQGGSNEANMDRFVDNPGSIQLIACASRHGTGSTPDSGDRGGMSARGARPSSGARDVAFSAPG